MATEGRGEKERDRDRERQSDPWQQREGRETERETE